MRLGEMAHRLETSVERLGQENLVAGDIEPLQGAYDAICARVDLLRQTDPNAHGVQQTAPEWAPAEAVVADAPDSGFAAPSVETAAAPRSVCHGSTPAAKASSWPTIATHRRSPYSAP